MSLTTTILGTLLAGLLFQIAGWKAGARFRSAERKTGQYRAEGGQGVSSKLPMTGGPALVLTLLLAGGLLSRTGSEWAGLWKPGIAILGFGTVGFADDFLKFRGRGLSQRWKTAGCLIVAVVVAATLTAQPLQGVHALRWAVETAFLFCFAVAADFSDGMDGLTGGLGWILACGMSFACAAAARFAGANAWLLWAVALSSLLVFNRPSAWTKAGSVPRRAKVYLGDSGALALGGGMAATALWMHMGWVFLPAAGVWLVEGFSSLWQAEFLAKFLYRRRGTVERYGADHAPHIEFPLPLLAAPVHHHFEVAGWDRLQTVQLLYAVAGVCAAGAVVAARFGTWMVVGFGISAAALAALWSLAGLYRTFYLAVGPSGNLALNSGIPFRLQARRYHKTAHATALPASTLTNDERLWLYRPLPRPDAMEMLARLLAAHGAEVEAAALAARMPAAWREMRLGDVPLDASETKG